MEVILLEKIRHLGSLGQKVRVKRGFARNYLVPQGKAVYATADNLAKFEERRAVLEKAAAEKMHESMQRQQAINALPLITIITKAGDEGKLFGSVGTRDIAEAIAKHGVTVEKREIRLSEGAIRLVGQYEVTIDLEGDVTAIVKLSVAAESH